MGYRTVKLGLFPEREALYRKLDARCAWMFENGLLDEVKHILSLGFAETCKPFESHGYKQSLQWMHGELSAEDAVTLAQRNTRRYAKRQETWFRRERDMEWLRGFGADLTVSKRALEIVAERF